MKKLLKGRYKGAVLHQALTAHDEVSLRFFQSFIPPDKDFWTAVEVYDEIGIGRIDVVIQGDEVYTLIEVKSKPEEVDEAIGQILRYKVLFSQTYQIDEDKINVGIVCPSFYPSHKKICNEIGIKLWEVKES